MFRVNAFEPLHGGLMKQNQAIDCRLLYTECWHMLFYQLNQIGMVDVEGHHVNLILCK